MLSQDGLSEMDQKRTTILLIEDDADTARIIQLLFGRDEFETERVHQLSSGLARIAKGGIDVVLLDLSLPDSQGLETLRRTLEGAPDVPIIALTATSDEAVVLTALQLGAQDYLIKGEVNRHLLVRAVRYAIERHRAEMSFRGGEERFRIVAETASDAILTIVPDGTILFASLAAEQIFGYSRDFMLGRSLAMLLPTFQDHLQTNAVADNRVKLNGNIASDAVELPGLHQSGREIALEVSFGAFLQDRRQVFVCIARDVTQRKLIEQVSRETEVGYRRLFETVPIGIYRTAPDGRILMANPTLLDMLGYDSFEELGQRNLEEEGWGFNNPRALFREMIEPTGEVQGLETTWRKRDGSVMWVRENAVLVRDPEGAVAYYEGAVEDITQWKQAEQALRDREERFRALIEHSWDGVVLLTPDGTAVFASSAIHRILGWKVEEYVGKNAFALIHEDDLPNVMVVFNYLLANPGATALSVYRYRHGNGSWRWVTARGTNLLEDPSVQAVVCNYQDITDRKRAEAVLKNAHNDLERRVEQRTTELQRRNRELATLNAVTAAVSRSLALPEVLTTFKRLLAEELNIPGGCVYRYDESQDSLELQTSWGLPEGLLAAWRTTAAARPYNERVIREREPILCQDLHEVSPLVDLGLDVARPDWQVSLSVPMLAKQEVQGVLDLFGEGPAAFGADEIPFFTALGQQVGVAIHNAWLYEAEKRARRTAETLREANLALTKTLIPAEVLEMQLAHLQRLIPFDSACVILRQSESELVIVALRGYEQWTDANLTTRITFDAGSYPHLQELLTTHESIIIPDAHEYPGWDRHLDGGQHVRSWLGVPLLAGGRVIGLYSLDKTEPGFFTSEHRRMAEALAAQAAVAIENAKLFDQVRTGREQLQVLSRRLVEVQESERRYLARELHDEIGQILTGLKIIIELTMRLAPKAIKESLSPGLAQVGELLTQVRNLSLDLRPSMLDDLGLLPALLWHFERYTAKTRVRVNFKHTGINGRYSPQIETAIYRIVQEALTNVARYAGVNEVKVRLWALPDQIGLLIEDHGVGLDTDAVSGARSYGGVIGMQERAALLGGTLTLESTPGSGTRVTAELPLDKDKAPVRDQPYWFSEK